MNYLKKEKISYLGLIKRVASKGGTTQQGLDFLKKKSPCLRCFIPVMPANPDIDNCEYEGVLGPLAGVIGSIQANEAVKEILKIGESLCGSILIVDALKLTFRKVTLNKRLNCLCNEKN